MSKALKSPCYECDIWKKWGSPDYLMHCPGPRECKKHQQYSQGIGPAGVGGVPVESTGITKIDPEIVEKATIISIPKDRPSDHVEKPEVIEKRPISVLKTKTCNRKQCANSGKPQPVEKFGKNSRNKRDGLQDWCKACMREYARERYGLKRTKPLRPTNATGVDAFQPLVKICRNKQCEFGGKPQPAENFGKKSKKWSADGLQSWCRACKNAYMKNYNRQIRNTVKTAATDRQILEQLFAGREDLLSQLYKLAELEFRTPRDQILYMVSKGN